MIEDEFFEAFAHYTSGMATMSFGMWAVTLYKWHRRNRMIFLLFLSMVYIAISFLKDTIFLIPLQLFPDVDYIENLVSIFDLGFVPLVCAFFLETTRPGFVTNHRLLAAFLPFIAMLPLYGVLRAHWVLSCSFLLSALSSLFTLVAVPVNVLRYNKFLSDNYSYTKNIGVDWCIGGAFGFFLLLAFYEVCFYEPTWFSEMTYDAFFVVVWNIVCLKGCRHRIVTDMMTFSNGTGETAEDMNGEREKSLQTAATAPMQDQKMDPPSAVNDQDAQSLSADDNRQERFAFIACSMRQCMEEDKIYLNTRLSLADLASAAGTNKTYISAYINSQGYTFYDYINKYRVEEACRILDKKTTGERLSMTDVASLSGFNSVSSFNRYFSKMKGVTPSAYLRKL